MKFRKVVLECGVIAASLAVVSVPSAVSVSAAETVSGVWNAEVVQDEAAGSEFMQALQENSEEKQSVNEESGEDVSDAETSEWENKLLVIVEEDSSLNVRSEANADSEIVGRMYRGSSAEVLEKGEEWSKISSGDVEGYVKNEYCVFAEEAEAQAEELCSMTATVTEDGVRLRSEANTDAAIYTVLSEGDTFTVSDSGSEEEADEQSGAWIAVEYGNTVAYIFADYVETELEMGEALSMEEVYAEQAAQAEAAAQSADAAVTAGTGTAVSASSDDLTLLAAIIQCEAGGESYEGQVAVGAVIMNRVKSGSFPNSISGVIYQSGQFTPASSGKLSRVLSSGNIYSSCYQAAQAALAGTDNTGGALYFHAGSGNGTVIGNQTFY